MDCFYWFDKSWERKGKLLEYFGFCDQEYQNVLKHIYLFAISRNMKLIWTKEIFTSISCRYYLAIPSTVLVLILSPKVSTCV